MARSGPSFPTAFGRGLAGRCPLCGNRGIFRPSRLDLRDDCPTCGLHFEREEGYWVGSMTVVTAMVLLVFGTIIVGSVALFWPDVPWTGVTIVGVLANLAIPVLGYGWAKSVWLGLSWGITPADVSEEAELVARKAAMDRESD